MLTGKRPDELVEARDSEVLRRPELSQPLSTALQLAILAVLESWGVRPQSVVGHSSGEIAAAYAAGYLKQEDAIKIAFYRGQAAQGACDGSLPLKDGTMMAVGLDPHSLSPYLEGLEDSVYLACFNSPTSVTLSGNSSALEEVQGRLRRDKHLSRILQVNLPYHSQSIAATTEVYEQLLRQEASLSTGCAGGDIMMFSTVIGKKLDRACDASYWKTNMASPVLFHQAMEEMLSQEQGPNILIEIGPSDTLKSPVMQIQDSLSGEDGPLKNSLVRYHSALKQGDQSSHTMFHLSGSLYLAGYPIRMQGVNAPGSKGPASSPSVVVDLPNYGWNHTAKYWYESEASRDWRFRKFLHHDLLGSKVLGCSWQAPSWTKTLRLRDSPWLRDHKIAGQVIFPASGYVAIAIEAIYQTQQALGLLEEGFEQDQLQYQLREIVFLKALILQEDRNARLMLSLEPLSRNGIWQRFCVSSLNQSVWHTHCEGMIRLQKPGFEGIVF
jgi:acyl transferase domain-containing protein